MKLFIRKLSADCNCIRINIYIYIYIERERERELYLKPIKYYVCNLDFLFYISQKVLIKCGDKSYKIKIRY